jgi:hypothetical protein
MPDLQTALAAIKLPAHFDDDNMAAAPDAAQEIKVISENYAMNKKEVVYNIIKNNPNARRQQVVSMAAREGVADSSAETYISHLMRENRVRSGGMYGERTYTIVEGAAPKPDGRKVRSSKPAVKVPQSPAATIDINNLKLAEAKALYDQLKAIFG